jgi:hypothetical protein
MSTHVHVRVRGQVSVNDHGELTEHLSCQCGRTWTRVHRLDDEPDRE